jgi:hypothetical protein
MVTHKTTEQAEAGVAPSAELVAGMGRLIHEMTMAGVLLAAEGLLPSSEGVRMNRCPGERCQVRGTSPWAPRASCGMGVQAAARAPPTRPRIVPSRNPPRFA